MQITSLNSSTCHLTSRLWSRVSTNPTFILISTTCPPVQGFGPDHRRVVVAGVCGASVLPVRLLGPPASLSALGASMRLHWELWDRLPDHLLSWSGCKGKPGQTCCMSWFTCVMFWKWSPAPPLRFSQSYLIGWEEFRKSKWLIGYTVVISISVIDWVLSVSMVCDEVRGCYNLGHLFFISTQQTSHCDFIATNTVKRPATNHLQTMCQHTFSLQVIKLFMKWSTGHVLLRVLRGAEACLVESSSSQSPRLSPRMQSEVVNFFLLNNVNSFPSLSSDLQHHCRCVHV